jgi:hypothetical protein
MWHVDGAGAAHVIAVGMGAYAPEGNSTRSLIFPEYFRCSRSPSHQVFQPSSGEITISPLFPSHHSSISFVYSKPDGLNVKGPKGNVNDERNHMESVVIYGPKDWPNKWYMMSKIIISNPLTKWLHE